MRGNGRGGDGNSRRGRGSSRNGRGRGRQGGNGGRGGYRNGGGSGGRRGQRGGGRMRRDPRAASDSGNKRERIAVESGFLVLIDQFMLANKQFTDKLLDVIDDAPESKDGIIKQYGGSVVEIPPGMYRIKRDPYAYTIVIHQDDEEVDEKALAEELESASGSVFIDTRCLAMIDRELLDDSGLLDKYHQLWMNGQEKACRDLLRDNGGAVRYGFQRYGDELGVYPVPDRPVVCMWPDVDEEEPAMGEAASA